MISIDLAPLFDDAAKYPTISNKYNTGHPYLSFHAHYKHRKLTTCFMDFSQYFLAELY